MANVSMRPLVDRFFRLRLSQRTAIMVRLNIPLADDPAQADFERFRGAVIQVRERGLLDAFIQEIAREESV